MEKVTGEDTIYSSVEYVADIFYYEVTEDNGAIRLRYGISD